MAQRRPRHDSLTPIGLESTGRGEPRGEGRQAFANRLINSLPGLGTDYRLLNSLRAELPLLAEAAPRPLLSALERMLKGIGDLIRPVFDEQEGFPFPTAKHTGLLRALDTLAWDPGFSAAPSSPLRGSLRLILAVAQ